MLAPTARESVEVPDYVRESPQRRCPWNWVLLSDGGLAARNAGWMFQTKKQHEQKHNGPKAHEGVGMGEQDCNCLATAANLVWLSQK